MKTHLPSPGAAIDASPIQVRWQLASVSLVVLLASLATSIGNVSLPSLAGAFMTSFQELQWVVLGYLLSLTTLVVSVGRMGDIVGHRRLLLAGILIFTAAAVLCGLAATVGMLVTARAVQGVGAAIMLTLAMAVASQAVPAGQIGRAMGLLGTMSALGTALGPALGGLLIAALGWRAIFLINLPLGVLAYFLVRRHLPGDGSVAPRPRTRFDYPGTLLLAATLAAYALAATLGRGGFDARNVVLLCAAAAGAVLLVRVEAAAAAPVIPLAMFRDPVRAANLATNAVVATVLMATLVVGPFHLSRGLGLNAALAGLVLAVGPVVVVLTGVPAGRLVDRMGATRASHAGLAGVAAGSLTLAAMPAASGLAGYVASIVVITASYALFQSANNAAILQGAPPDQRGVLSGLLNLSRNLGLITGTAVMGAVFAAITGDITTASPEATVLGMRTAFAVAGALVLAAILIIQLIRVRSRGGATIASPGSGSTADWMIPALLIAWSLIPAVAGTVQVVALAAGVEITPANARFFAARGATILHIGGAVAFSLLGAFQFSPGLRRRALSWHRVTGWFVVPAGLVAAFSGLWLAHHRGIGRFAGDAPADYDGTALYYLRLLAGAAMAGSLVLAMTAILKRDIAAHRAWMIRGYALGLGAGTQVLTHAPWFLFPTLHGELARTLCMGAGWAINVAVAEWLIARIPAPNTASGITANAVVLDTVTEPSTWTKVAKALLGTSAPRNGKAVAVYVLPEKHR